MNKKGRIFLIFSVLLITAAVGAGAIIFVDEANKYSSNDAFCTSCHTMANVANDPIFQQSDHIANAQGLRPSCGDCHIPNQNIFIETYTHLTSGIKDGISEWRHDFNKPGAWEAYRVGLAHQVREKMRKQDSVTCRNCHEPDTIIPTSIDGKAAHALLQTQKVTCIDCHINLVHSPVPPSASFIQGSGLGVNKTSN